MNNPFKKLLLLLPIRTQIRGFLFALSLTFGSLLTAIEVDGQVGCDACATSGVFITEIMYNPDGSDTGCEYIEIFNGYNNTIDLGGWSLSNGVSFTFPPGTMLASGGYVIVSSGTTANCQGGGYDLSGSLHIFSGTLTNTAETIELSSNATCTTPPIAASVSYVNNNGGNGDGNSQSFSIGTPGTFLAAGPPTPGTGDCVACSDMMDLICPIPRIAVDKNAGNVGDALNDLQTVAEGGTASFSINIENTGTEALCNLVITDPNGADCVLTTAEINALISGVGDMDTNWDPGEILSYTCVVNNVMTSFTNVVLVMAEGCSSGGMAIASDPTEVFVPCEISNIVVEQNCTNTGSEYEICITFERTGIGASTMFEVLVGGSSSADLVGTYTYAAYDAAVAGNGCFTIPASDFTGDAMDLESFVEVCVSDEASPAPRTGLPPGSMPTGVSSIPNFTCPQIFGILVDACGDPESTNEFVVLVNGADPLPVSGIDVDTPSGSDYDDFNTTIPPGNWTCPCCIYVNETSTIPPNGTIIVTSAANTTPLDFTSLCNAAGTLFVLQDDGTGTQPHFANTAARTTLLNISETTSCNGTESYTYTTASVSGGDGDYTQFAGPDSPTYSSPGDNGSANANPDNIETTGECTPQIAPVVLEVECFACGTFDEELCCEFTASCPISLDLGSFDCTELRTIPPGPTSLAEVTATPYNMIIGDMPCGRILVEFSDDITFPDICAMGGQTIMRTVTVFDDVGGGGDAGNGILDGDEESQVCVYTITIEEDMTAPVAPAAPVDMIVQCPSDIPRPDGLTATDNCEGDLIVSPTEVITPGACMSEFVLVRTWTFVDACGNESSVTQTITVNDDTAPVAPMAPADVTVQCAGDVPAPVDLTAVDNCDGDIVASPVGVITPGACANNFVMVRTWTFADACGNESSVAQTITVNDDTAPVAPVAPADITVQCAGDVPAPVDLTAVDNCDGDIIASPVGVITPGACANNFVMVRTWTFTDVCGNESSVTQMITVNDDMAPVAPMAPADITVQCAGDVPAPVDLTAVDNCDGDIIASPVGVVTPGACANNFVMVRTWTFVDACGNTSSVTQTITVNDDMAPVAPMAPADITVQCAGDVPAPVDLTAVDNCDGDIVSSPVGVITPGACANNFVMVRTWTFADACGNTSSVTQTITVNDDMAPVAPMAPADITVQCAGDIPAPVDLTAVDNCDGDIVASPVGVITPGGCANNFVMVRTWTFADVCGNESSVTQTITVNDDTAPVAPMAPADITVQCAGDVPAPVDLTAVDNCDGDIVSSPVGIITPGACANNFVMVRTWTFVDVCGNESSVTQTITVNDDTAPVAPMAPADITVQCAGDVPAPVDLTAVDNCDGDIISSPLGVITPGACANNFVMVRTWTFADACGNTSSVTQTITVNDDMAPVAPMAPADITVQCAGDVPAPVDLTAVDNCDGDIVSSPLGVITPGGCANNFVMVRTWTFADACGNESSVTQTITVNDDMAPVVPMAPADITVDCPGDIPPAPELVAVDACSGIISGILSTEIVDQLCASQFTMVRTFTFDDGCGNISTVIQNIIVASPDVLTVFPLPNHIIDCEVNIMPQEGLIEANSFSPCESPITVTSVINGPFGEAGCPGTFYNVVYTVTDDCGRSVQTTQRFTIQNEGPEFIYPPDICIIECPADNDMIQATFDAYAELASVTSSCVENSEMLITNTFNPNNFIPNNCGSGPIAFAGTIEYQIVTFQATDPCGRSTSCTALVVIVDNTPPTIIGTPNSGSAECSDDVQTQYDTFIQAQLSLLSATDDCTDDDDLEITTSPATPNLTCVDGLAKTSVEFTVMDPCGNSASVSAWFILTNSNGPSVEDLPDLTVECGMPLNFGTPVVSGACGSTSVTFVDNTNPASCPAISSTTRTFTVTDACGGSTTVEQTISEVDTQAPVTPAAPADITVSCAENIPAPVSLTATDNCAGLITISPTPTITPGACDDQFLVVRTWTFDDGCNISTVSQTITINDDVAPVFTFVPPSMSGQCMGTIIEFEDAEASDNCNGVVTITFVDETNTSGVCGVTLTRTWTATDACGNSSTATATMSMGDTEAPVVSNVPMDMTIDCGITPQFGMPTFTDNCATDVTVVMSDATVDGDCDGETIFIRIWTATDECDNTTVITQSISTQDNEGPVFVSVPGGTFECNSGSFGDPVITDNCSSFNITFVDEETGTGCAGSMVRTYTATDDCGNVTTASATFIFNDDEAPIFTEVPNNIDVDCSMIPEFIPPVVEDNCGEVALTFVEEDFGDLCDLGFSRRRTWTATDGCGNTASVVTAIWVNTDNTPPLFTFVPETEIIDCEDFPPTFGEVIVEDDCSEVIISFIDEFIFGDENSCANGENFDFRRTWTATDDCGNTSTAQQSIWVNAGPSNATISGTLITEADELVDNVTITLENSNATNLSQLSNDGNYLFNVFLNQNYTITPERNDDPLNGITTYDLILLGRHILELETLESPYKLIAADINKSGSVTSLDMIGLRRLILHIDEVFTNNTSWRFVEHDYVFPDPANPFSATFPELSNFNGITQSQISDYMAIKIGDLNDSATPNQLVTGDTRNLDGNLILQLENISLVPGEQYEVAFKAQDFEKIRGYQYTLNLSDLELVDIKAGALRNLTLENFGMTNLNKGMLTTSWHSQTPVTIEDGETLFSLIVNATEANKLSKMLWVSSDLTTAEGYSEVSDKLEIEMQFEEEREVVKEGFELYQNRPNPFSSETTISFVLPEATDVSLTIFDVSGQILKQVKGAYSSGYHEALIERNELGVTGVLYYQLQTETETATRKMILMKK